MSPTAGKFIILFGPSGSGKGELVRYALSRFSNLHFPVSATTRAMRPGETNGKEYHFLSRKEFEKKRDAEELLEWAEYGGNLYGTLKREITTALEAGRVVLHEIDFQGVKQLEALIPKEERVIVFVDAGSWDELKTRILARAPMSEKELEKRETHYKHETAYEAHADVVISNRNGELPAAKEKFAALVTSILEKASKVS